jgi:GntR family transcriptional regulator/MocR family aminotransferase
MQRAILRTGGAILKRASKSASLSLVLDRISGRPMYLQLCDFLRQAILTRSLPPGHRLPSTRVLAGRLQVSRNTVLNAYEALVSEGLMEGRIGSGTRISKNVSDAPQLLVPNIPDARTLLRQAHYPVVAAGFYDPDDSPLYLHG